MNSRRTFRRTCLRMVSIGVICVGLACLLSSCLAQKSNFHKSYINCVGTTVISVPNGFESLSSFSEGLAPVAASQGWGYLDGKGDVAIKPQYVAAQGFSEGVAAVALQDDYMSKQDGKFSSTKGKTAGTNRRRYGFINKLGKSVIPFTFNQAMPFSEGLAGIEIEDSASNGKNVRSGYINHSGRLVIPARFSANGGARKFSEGLAAVAIGGHVINQEEAAKECQVGMWSPGKFGYIDHTGKVVIPHKFDMAREFSSEGLAPVGTLEHTTPHIKKLLFGFIDRSGDYAISPRFLDAYPFSEGLAPVALMIPYKSWTIRKFGYIDATGKMAIEPAFEYAGSFSSGLALVGIGDGSAEPRKYGYINRSGKFVIPAQYDSAQDFSEGLAAVNGGGPE